MDIRILPCVFSKQMLSLMLAGPVGYTVTDSFGETYGRTYRYLVCSLWYYAADCMTLLPHI